MNPTPRLRGTVTAVATVFFLLTACAQAGAGSPTGGSSNGHGTDPTLRHSPTAQSRSPLLTVVRGGGLAGGTVEVTVRAEGTWLVRQRGAQPRNGRLGTEALQRLRELLAGERYAALPERTFDRPSPDAYTYTFRTPAPDHRPPGPDHDGNQDQQRPGGGEDQGEDRGWGSPDQPVRAEDPGVRTVIADDTSLREPLDEIVRLLRPAFAAR